MVNVLYFDKKKKAAYMHVYVLCVSVHVNLAWLYNMGYAMGWQSRCSLIK
jgi:hypothetical protein